jgi:hypothetical protein
MLPHMNVKIETLDEFDNIIATQSGHNIVVLPGREYLSKIIANKSLPSSVPETPEAFTVADPYITSRIAYLAVGVGGQNSYYSSAFTEIAPAGTAYNTQVSAIEVPGLEAPVPFAWEAAWDNGAGNYRWLKILNPNTDDDFIDNRTMRFQTVIESDELTFPWGEQLSTQYRSHSEEAVYISELLLLSSRAYANKPPTTNVDADKYYWLPTVRNDTRELFKVGEGFSSTVTGIIAYDLCMPVVKYANNRVKITWEFMW